jgi:hypothetical protein
MEWKIMAYFGGAGRGLPPVPGRGYKNAEKCLKRLKKRKKS